MSGISGLEKFDTTGDPSSVGPRWKAWLKAFELFADGEGLIEQCNDEKKETDQAAEAGNGVQSIHDTSVGDEIDVFDYTETVGLLEHFIPQTNSTFQRKVFREMVQQSDKSIAQFATHLRKAGEYCNYTDLDDQIRDQIVQKCLSQQLRRNLLEKGEGFTFKETLEIADQFETVVRQLKSMSVSDEIIHLSSRPKSSTARQNTIETPRPTGRCYRCNREGHMARDKACPAKGKTCDRC